MKKILFCIIAILSITCCSPSHGNDNDVKAMDLAKLSFNENLPELMNALHIKPEQINSETTLYNLEMFKTGDPKVMTFSGQDLSDEQHENHVVFHYDHATKKLALYELVLSSSDAVKELENDIAKHAVSVYHKIGVSKGAVELDENGNEIHSKDKEEYQVWEDKKTGLSYFLSTRNGDQLSAELTVLDPSTPSGKDWIKFRSLDWYK